MGCFYQAKNPNKRYLKSALPRPSLEGDQTSTRESWTAVSSSSEGSFYVYAGVVRSAKENFATTAHGELYNESQPTTLILGRRERRQ
jgi:hypothetical protein